MTLSTLFIYFVFTLHLYLLFCSCQMFLNLWDFCPPRAIIDDSFGNLWVRKKWNKFNLKAFNNTAWSGRNGWHSRASSKRKW